MIVPEFLKAGDKIGIVAPARFIAQEKYKQIISLIEAKGFIAVRGESTYLEHGPFAGTDEERRLDIQNMLDDSEIKALFCLRGGYGSIRIINDIDFTSLIENPKWIIGFSDITIFHNKLHQLNVASIHGQMPLNFVNNTESKGLTQLFETIKGNLPTYSLANYSLNRQGHNTAPLVGGNVAILCSLIGTDLDLETDGKILFIEEVGEYLYRFDRLMHHLKLSGKLSKLKGLVIGGLTDMKDNDPAFGQSAEEIIQDLVQDYSYPVAYGFPAGHIKENYPLIMGSTIELTVNDRGAKLQFC